MSYTAVEASYIGKGTVHVGPYDGSGPMVEIGNVDEAVITESEDEKTLKDFTSISGGNSNSVRRVDKVEFSLRMRDFTPANFARSVLGTTSSVTAGTVTDESHANVKQDGLVCTVYPIDTAVAPVVKVGAATKTVTTDYVVTPAGIIIVAGGGIADDDTVLVSYTKAASTVVEALVTAAKDFKIVLIGLNEAQSGRPVILYLHKVRLGAAASLALFGDDYASLEVKGECLADPAITTTGASKFYKATLVS